jgi:hypothetical protein
MVIYRKCTWTVFIMFAQKKYNKFYYNHKLSNKIFAVKFSDTYSRMCILQSLL